MALRDKQLILVDVPGCDSANEKVMDHEPIKTFNHNVEQCVHIFRRMQCVSIYGKTLVTKFHGFTTFTAECMYPFFLPPIELRFASHLLLGVVF